MKSFLGTSSRRSQNSRDVNTVEYIVSTHNSLGHHLSLVDRGANGGVGGEDVRLISRSPHHTVDIQGIDNHMMNAVPIGTVGGVVDTHRGPCVAIFHNYAYTGRGSSIHSSAQLESYKNHVDDRSRLVGGKQRIITIDGYIIPLRFQRGLARLPIRPYSNSEFDQLPHIILTSELMWDPSDLDHDLSDGEILDETHHLDDFPRTSHFDECGDHVHRVAASTVLTKDELALSFGRDPPPKYWPPEDAVIAIKRISTSPHLPPSPMFCNRLSHSPYHCCLSIIQHGASIMMILCYLCKEIIF